MKTLRVTSYLGDLLTFPQTPAFVHWDEPLRLNSAPREVSQRICTPQEPQVCHFTFTVVTLGWRHPLFISEVWVGIKQKTKRSFPLPQATFPGMYLSKCDRKLKIISCFLNIKLQMKAANMIFSFKQILKVIMAKIKIRHRFVAVVGRVWYFGK